MNNANFSATDSTINSDTDLQDERETTGDSGQMSTLQCQLKSDKQNDIHSHNYGENAIKSSTYRDNFIDSRRENDNECDRDPHTVDINYSMKLSPKRLNDYSNADGRGHLQLIYVALKSTQSNLDHTLDGYGISWGHTHTHRYNYI